MALSPEDVINKRFQPTKFREGYDQDEVDDFLDEIVAELRRLNQENTGLQQQLEAAGRPVAPRGSVSPPVAGTTSPEPSAEDAAAGPSSPVAPVAEGPAAGPSAPVAPVAGTTAAEPAAPAAETPVPDATQSAANVLAMAQKLHDEYVAEGSAERERIVDEARAQAEELVGNARRTREETLGRLRDEEAELQHRVSGLRAFERDYRTGLRQFIQEQLQDLDTAPSPEPARVEEPASAPAPDGQA